MKRTLISEEERSRILGMHQEKGYKPLMEQSAGGIGPNVFTNNGKTYNLPTITDLAKLNEFTINNYPKFNDLITNASGNVINGKASYDVFKNLVNQQKGEDKLTPYFNMWAVTNATLDNIAQNKGKLSVEQIKKVPVEKYIPQEVFGKPLQDRMSIINQQYPQFNRYLNNIVQTQLNTIKTA